MLRLSTLLLIAVLIMSTGCASIVSHSRYGIGINSEPNDAKVKVINQKGDIVFLGTTPVIAPLKSGAGYFKKASYEIVFEKEGYEPKTLEIESVLDEWYIGNILFFGGDLGVGFLIIDPLTGAMWKFDEDVYVELLPIQRNPPPQ